MENNLISICIPAYSMNGAGAKCLKQLLQTITAQTFKDYEVIISDHSQDDELLKIVDTFNNNKIKHFFNRENYGSSSANINNAIKNASGNKIKIMFQDDFFVNENALDIINSHLNNHIWGVSSCIHYKTDCKQFYRPHYPYWQDNIKRGENTLGAPSVVFYRKNDIYFDNRLIWFMDVEFYYRLYKTYGSPFIENKILVGIREDETRVSSTLITDEIVERENKILDIINSL